MIEDAQRIIEYLPISFRNVSEQEYINFLWETFVTNYQAEKYPFAFLAYHMLFMSFVYFEIWQIKANHSDDFQKAMIGFNKDMENELMQASTPFTLWQVSESSVFRFLKLIGMSNTDIGQCTKIVKERNDAAHSNGNIFFRNQLELDDKIEEILKCVDIIQGHSSMILESCYERFLVEGADKVHREFGDDEDQIREILVYGNYLSPRDIEILKCCPLDNLANNVDFENIMDLVNLIEIMYPDQ